MQDGVAHEHAPLSADEEVLKLVLEDLQRENGRLRTARASLTSQLGPLPISAALVAGLVSGFTIQGAAHLNGWFIGPALAAFALMVLVSVAYGAVEPYRKLRDRAELQCRPPNSRVRLEYYRAMIRIEEEVRGRSIDDDGDVRSVYRPILPWRAETLQDGFDAEWQGLFLTKLLFIAVIVLLILARITT